ncbi:MAG: sugar phosphate isomerase/epimerase [Deltaproteobacteria bacterium]|jgi:sugar phosphate isomerase/epimerase|nr:sugar phosphate isomerase/epimerase [Deltaproteobacteria bacterium]
MFAADELGLCCGSLVQTDLRGLVEAAANAGFKTITLWPTLFETALEQGASEQDLRNLLADHGLSITELDPLCSWLPIDPSNAGLAGPFAAYSEDDFFRIADVLGARTLNVIHATEVPVERAEMVERLGALCERAARHELAVSIEFLPWSPIADLGTALELVEAAGQPNCGVNIDTWHHFRSGGDLGQLAALDADHVAALQFNDVATEPWDDVIQETSTGRLLPGKGASNSAAVLRALWDAGVRVPLSAEIFNAELIGLPAVEAAERIRDSMHEVLAAAAH